MQTRRQKANEEAALVLSFFWCLDSMPLSISHMKFLIDVLVITALLPPLPEVTFFPTSLGITFITCPSKVPHGVVLD